MSEYTKQREIMQYTEIIFFKDGEEIGRERQHDDHAYDSEPMEAMTEDEIDDWGDEGE